MADQFEKDVRDLFDCKTGERIMANLKAAYGDRISHGPDPYETAFREGQRSVYLELLAALEPNHE